MTALWPTILTIQDAKSAAMLGTAACVARAAGTLYLIFFAKGTHSSLPLVDLGLIAVFGFGIWRMWRTAAVLALIYFIVLEVIFYMDATSQIEGSSVIFTFILLTMFVNGLRGTIAYHTLVKREKQRVATAIAAA